MIRHWIALWDRREVPHVLAAVRIGVGLVLLLDFLTLWRLDLVTALLAGAEHGGLSRAAGGAWEPLWYAWFGDGLGSARALHAGLVLTSLCLTAGWFSRASAIVLMLLYAQAEQILPEADRGIDVLLRNVLMALGLSRCGAAWSLDAVWATGRFAGDGQPVPAWPRYLLILQIVAMYFTAGVQKYAQHWWPWGELSALYVILQDWAYARAPFGWLANQPFYAFTQLSTLVTMVFQWTYPVVLLHYFPGRGEPGRLRRAFDRYHLHWLWIAIGGLFHLGIAATMELGIFPWGMLALYPVFAHPDEWARILSRLQFR